MPFPCPHCATPQEDSSTSCNHCGLTFGPGTDRLTANTADANGAESSQVTNFQELLAAVAARGSEVDPRAIPPPAPAIDLSRDPNEVPPQQGQPYPQPGQQYMPQGYGQPGMQLPPGQYYPPGFVPVQPQYGQQAPYNITLYPNGSPQGINITQYPQFSGMNATIMPVAVPVRQGLSVPATLLLAALFGTLVAMVVFLLLHNVMTSGPNIKISQPQSGTIIASGQTVDFSVEAADSMGHLNHVDFYYAPAGQVHQFIKTVLSPPYSVDWTPTTSGDYVLEAVASDDHGETSTAQTSVRVNGESVIASPPASVAPLKPVAPVAAHAPSPAPVKPAAIVSPVAAHKPAPKPVPAVHKTSPVSHSAAAPSTAIVRRARGEHAVQAAANRPQHPAVHYAEIPPKATQTVAHHAAQAQYHITTLVSPRRQNADVFAAALRKRGYNVNVQHTGTGWAVETPGYQTRADASTAAKQLLKSGYNAGISSQ